ncbi:MAG: hypothetical protein CL534_01200 [Ahrensia sp.]|nr:hypothetical protein [Ahrensia sp.]
MTDHRDNEPTDKPTTEPRKRGLSGMQVFAPFLASATPVRKAQRQADEQDRAERRAMAAHASDSPLNQMYQLTGHSPDCIAKVRRGLIVSCDCRTRPVEDPAVAVGLALHYEKFARTGKISFPKSIARLVEAGAANGDEACRMMLERLRRRGWADRPKQDGDQDSSSGRSS